MNLLYYHKNFSRLYFNQWSNKSFSIFISIRKEVVIGKISSLLNDLRTVKSLVVSLIESINIDQDSDEEKDDAIQESNGWLHKIMDEGMFIFLFSSSRSNYFTFIGLLNKSYRIINRKALSRPFFIWPFSKTNLNRMIIHKLASRS